MNTADGKSVSILLIEDNDIDAEAIQRAFRKHRIANPVVVASDGQRALDYLRGRDDGAKLLPPFVILLDLNLPRMDGFEFLAKLRKDATLAKSIVFVLTSSDLEQDKAAAYQHHIAGYVVKSKINDGFHELINMLRAYCRLNEFPPN